MNILKAVNFPKRKVASSKRDITPKSWDELNRDFSSCIDTIVMCLQSVNEENKELFQERVSDALITICRTHEQLTLLQVRKETTLQDLANERKNAVDKLRSIERHISILDSYVTMASERRAEIDQEENMKELLNKCSIHYQQAENELKEKATANWRQARAFTSALAKCELEARRAHRMMQDFKAENSCIHDVTKEMKKKNLETIVKSKNSKVEDINEKNELINEKNNMIRNEKAEVERLDEIRAFLDPIAINCQVLHDLCSTGDADFQMVYLLLEQLALSVARLCVFSPEAEALLMLESQTRNMEILDNFLSCSRYNPSQALLTFEGGAIGDFSHLLPYFVPYDRFHGAPNISKTMNEIATCIVKMHDLMSVESRDFSPSDFPPRNGFVHLDCHGSFLASIEQVQNTWRAYLINTRNLFLMFELHTRLAASCLLEILHISKTDGSITESQLDKSSIFLTNLSHQLKMVSEQGERNFDDLDGIVEEITEICSDAKSQTAMSQGGLPINKDVYMKEGEVTQDEVKRMIEEKKKLAERIEKVQEEFAKKMMDLQGVVNLLSATAAERTVTTFQISTSFFRKFTEKALNFDVGGCMNTFVDTMGELFVRDDDENDATARSILVGHEKLLEDVLSKELMISVNILAIKTTIELLVVILQENYWSEDEKREKVLEAETKRKIDVGQLKTEHPPTKLERILFPLADAFETLMGHWETQVDNFGTVTPDSWDTHPTYQKVLADFVQAQASLDNFLRIRWFLRRKSNIISQVDVIKIQFAVNEMLQMLRKLGGMDKEKIRGTMESIKAVLEGAVEDHTEFEKTISTALKSCQTLLDEFKSSNISEGTVKKVTEDLQNQQKSLEEMAKKTDRGIEERRNKLEQFRQVVILLTRQPRPQRKGNLILRQKVQELDVENPWKRYDRKTDEITSLFEVQEETAQVISELTLKLNQLEENLSMMKGFSKHLSNLQENIWEVNRGTQSLTNAIQKQLCPMLDKVTTQMTRCLETVKSSKTRTVSQLKQELIMEEIKKVLLTAKNVYDSSKAFQMQCNA